MWCKEKKRQARQSEQAQRNLDENRSASQHGNAALPPPPPLPTLPQTDKDKTQGVNMQAQFASNLGAGFMTGSFISSKGKSQLPRTQNNSDQGNPLAHGGIPPAQDVGISSNFMPAVNFQTGQSFQKKEKINPGGFMPGVPHTYPAYGSSEQTGNNFASSRGTLDMEHRNSHAKNPSHNYEERGKKSNQQSKTFYEQLSPAGDAERSKNKLQSSTTYNYQSLKAANSSSKKDIALRDGNVTKQSQNSQHQGHQNSSSQW